VNPIIQTLITTITELRAQFDARFGHQLVLTERAKIGMLTGGVLLILATLIGLYTWVGKIETNYHNQQFDLAKLKAQVESGAWSERKNQSHILKSVLEDRFWTAETPGLAEAGFERWFRDHLNRGVEPQQIQVRRSPLVRRDDASADERIASLQRMTAKIIMPFDEPTLISLLADIAANPKTMMIDRMIVRAGTNARVEMDVSTIYRFHERAK
jgi:hypothetical protein